MGAPISLPVPLALDAQKLLEQLSQEKTRQDRDAVEAAIDLSERRVRPDAEGFQMDVYGTLSNVEDALRQGLAEAHVVGKTISPKRRAADLQGLKFDQILGFFETRYTQGQKYKDRIYNLRLAASKLDGTIVLPGEIFDFNATVGARDEAHGYRVAPVIAQGELVDGLGGGTCQISGTLHAAVFFAGLDIIERYPHSRPSWYIKLGLDATVAYPAINYRFKNSLPFPIVVHETVQDGVVRAEILGPERAHTVSYFRRIDEVLPFEEATRESERVPRGDKIVVQRGIPGFKTTGIRVVRRGAHAVREKWATVYPPTNQIVTVGTGPKTATGEAEVHPDTHPEYVVDEYLVLTQGPDVSAPTTASSDLPAGMIESRDPGKTGERGWMTKAGLLSGMTDPEADREKSKKDGTKSEPATSASASKPGKQKGGKR